MYETPASTPANDELHGRVAGALGADYELGVEIGRGGMGVVYRATDKRLQRDVAVKVLPPELSFRAELRERFLRESQLAGGLSHPNIVPIHDVGEGNGLVWYVMSFVDGESVRSRVVRDGPMTPAQTRRIIREVAWALSYAHARGIVHRDIKPDNIMLERGTGRALVTDFGIAKIAEGDTPGGATMPGMILGSLMYMAPEQATGERDIDFRADIYSLGMSGYFMLHGGAPFERATIVSVAARIATGAGPDWDAIEQPVEPALRDLLERCVQANPDDRWETAEELLEALGLQAVAPRPMPAPIRRLVRDFMLVPTLGFIVLVIDIVTEGATLGEFIGWMALIITVNFGVTLRSFTQRGFRWADLRDALEMELARQSEELEATGALKQRFSAIIHLATFAGIATAFLQMAVIRGFDPLIPIAFGFLILSALITVPAAWIQVKVYSFFGRLFLKLMPSIPRPEGEGWFSRLADSILTKLFRPLGQGDQGLLPAPATTGGWNRSDVGTARRSTRSIDDIYEELPRDVRNDLGPAHLCARELASAIHDLRHERATIDRERQREAEALTSLSRQASVTLERLHDALQDLSEGTSDVDDVEAIVAQADRILNRRETPGKKQRASSGWLGVQLGAAVTGSSPYQDVELSPRLSEIVTGQWERSQVLQGAFPGAEEDVRSFIEDVTRLQASVLLQKQRGHKIDPAAAESMTECRAVLGELLDALDRYDGETDGNTQELDGLLQRVKVMHTQVESVMEVEKL